MCSLYSLKIHQTVKNMTTENKPIRIRVFIDYWNVQLTFNEKEENVSGQVDCRVKIDWQKIGQVLAKVAAGKASIDNYSFDGAIIYASYNPKTIEGRNFNKWITTWLNRQTGIQVNCLERQPKAPPKCPSCHKIIDHCPHTDCGAKIAGTIEKGVDTLIITDMIRFAWENAYDVAVLASSDRDLVPGVQFLNSKGLKVIQAGFPPSGVHLATSCWGSFDIYSLRSVLLRK